MMVASFVSGFPFLDTLLDIFVFDFDGQDAPVGEKFHWELLHPSSSFGHRELKVGREYKVNMFNGFINA